ncbi:MAG: ChaN family lipoprotein [Bacteroidales bacterium]|jgi:uncharacterized iron-regulated protein
MKLSILILLTGMTLSLAGQDKPAYAIFKSEGKEASYKEMIKELLKADIVFFGELHDDPIAHWLELEVTKSLFAEKGKNLVMGAEMFETDNQLLLDEYLAGKYDASKFEAEAKLWKNYKTDYKPLVELARTNKLQFIATNVPRRYASMVNKGGFASLDSLSDGAKKLIAPLPVLYDPEVKCYKDMLSMGNTGPGTPMHGGENLPRAQAVKDATMAHFILSSWAKGQLFIHYNGSYHSRNFEGIIWYLRKANPDLRIVTIEAVQQDDLGSLSKENRNVSTFIIAIPSAMTRTY